MRVSYLTPNWVYVVELKGCVKRNAFVCAVLRIIDCKCNINDLRILASDHENILSRSQVAAASTAVLYQSLMKATYNARSFFRVPAGYGIGRRG